MEFHHDISWMLISPHSDLDPAEGRMLKLTRVNWRLPKEVMEKERPCHDNGGCSEICVGNPLHKEVRFGVNLYIQ